MFFIKRFYEKFKVLMLKADSNTEKLERGKILELYICNLFWGEQYLFVM